MYTLLSYFAGIEDNPAPSEYTLLPEIIKSRDTSAPVSYTILPCFVIIEDMPPFVICIVHQITAVKGHCLPAGLPVWAQKVVPRAAALPFAARTDIRIPAALPRRSMLISVSILRGRIQACDWHSLYPASCMALCAYMADHPPSTGSVTPFT